MQLPELSAEIRIPLRALQLYVRMGLLPALPVYDESHVRRAVLVRTLLDVGGLSYSAARRVVRQIDMSPPPISELCGTIQYALPSPGSEAEDQNWDRARERVHALARARKWRVRPENPAWHTLTQALVAVEWLGHDDLLRLLDTYADALEPVVAAEVRLLHEQPDPESAAAHMVTGTVLGDVAFSALRRLIHEHASSQEPSECP